MKSLITELKMIRDRVVENGLKNDDIEKIKKIINDKKFNLNETFFDIGYLVYNYITPTMYLCEIMASVSTDNPKIEFIKEYIKNNADTAIIIDEYSKYDLITVLIYNLKSQYLKVQTIDFLIEHFKTTDFIKAKIITDELKLSILNYLIQKTNNDNFKQKLQTGKQKILNKKINNLKTKKESIEIEIKRLENQLKEN